MYQKTYRLEKNGSSAELKKLKADPENTPTEGSRKKIRAKVIVPKAKQHWKDQQIPEPAPPVKPVGEKKWEKREGDFLK